MKDNNKNNYLISCVCSICILMVICYFGIGYGTKSTYAGFGGLSGCMFYTINVSYDPNYPDNIESPSVHVVPSCNGHKILDNMFEVPEGYIFNGWNSSKDGSGKIHYVGGVSTFDDSSTIYAQWFKIPVEKTPLYGDVDENGKIEESDSLLVLDYLKDSSILTDDMLINADVNGDDKVDEIDADIIHHVVLETEGYVGYLPDKIVPIYVKYEVDVPADDNVDVEDSDDSIVSNGTGTGSGTSGNGIDASGSGTGGNTSGNVSGNKPSNNNATNKKPANNKEEIKDNKKEEVVKEEISPIIYKFKFYNDDKEFDNTSCKVLKGSTCDLVLPKGSPGKNGYTFTGWSLIKDCPNESGIIKSMAVNSDNTYYACFQVNENKSNVYTYIIVGFIMTIIWGVAIYGICFLVKKFKNMEIED